MMYDDGDPDLAYAVTNAMFEQYENYKDAAPAANGYALERQKLEWILPYHEGAIRYYEEKGLWTEAQQANQDKLEKSQDVLTHGWPRPEEHTSELQSLIGRSYADSC